MISNQVYLIFSAAVEMAGYEWFLTNIVNNHNGGWPLAIGSDKFVDADFDMAEGRLRPMMPIKKIASIESQIALS